MLGLILTLLLNPISGKTNFSSSHSYPKSGGLSGSGHSSSGLSGAGSASSNSHGYPSSRPTNSGHSYPSTGNSHSYPTPGRSPTYPKSVGSSMSGGNQGYPSSAGIQKSQSIPSSHSYPAAVGSHNKLSGGSSSYPKAGSSAVYPKPADNHQYPKTASTQASSSFGTVHSYPPSGGHTYPSSAGSLNSSIVKHSYPPSQVSNSPSTGPYPSPGGSWNTSRNTPPLIGVNQGMPSSGSHSYPSSTVSPGYPTNNVHSYPSPVGKLNSTSGKHSYPTSGAIQNTLSGTNQGLPSTGKHSYPSSTSSHSYPAYGSNMNHSSGKHTYPNSGSSNTHLPSSGGSHSHPSSTNTHTYPNSGRGLSGGGHGHSSKQSHHSTYVYNNYRYKPPTKIVYIPHHGNPPINYPVYHGPPPNYVYQYKDSGSKYSTLLAGLALMNLGALGAAGYAVHQANHKNEIHNYKPHPNELCKFGMRKENGDYEEIKIDCQIISSFILQEKQRNLVNSPTFTYINSNGTQGQGVASPVNSAYTMLPNGTLVDVINVNAYSDPSMTAPQTPHVSQYDILPNGTLVPKGIISGSFGGIINAAQLKSASDLKGVPVKVTSKTECFVMSHSPTWNIKTPIPCRLLQTYADSSLHTNSGVRNIPPIFTVVVAILVYGIVY